MNAFMALAAGLLVLACGPIGSPTWHADICSPNVICGTLEEVQAWAEKERRKHGTNEKGQWKNEGERKATKKWKA